MHNEFTANISRIKINHIKCFDEIEINFTSSHHTTLIIGVNARGKSTILQLIALGFNGIKTVPFPYSWKQVVKTNSDHGAFEIDIVFGGKLTTLKFEVNQDDTITCIQGDDFLKSSIKDKFLLLAYGANRHIKLEDPKPYKEFDAIATLFGENGYLKHIRISTTFEYVNNNFKIIQQLINAVLEKSDHGNNVILVGYDASSLYFKTPSNPHQHISIEALSEGFKSTFVWLFDMIIRIAKKGGNLNNAQDITGLVLLDEIDLHLHPSWQRTILSSIETVFPNIHFIVSSHSVFVAQSIKNENLIALEWDNEKIVVIDSDTRSERSYSAIARELFKISSPFSYETEQKLNTFYEMQKKIRRNETVNEEEFVNLVIDIARKGIELEGVMRREIQSLERRIGKTFSLWKR
ncbi:AAA family ATPase [Candidatus Parabeggiatoa sp. HSG14]|uniref:AAA family ATPase n=1 Tax=Candidatus Parabeggiatoa sp. HSG14 TaxID=3055593 RepID=UPI0025A6CAEE|nr:AAA family ATPase [Thiotrichales bacterium HSG14]